MSGVDSLTMFSKLNSPLKMKSEIESVPERQPKTVPTVELAAQVSPGQYLKAVRERLQIGMREVQDASEVIAGGRRE